MALLPNTRSAQFSVGLCGSATPRQSRNCTSRALGNIVTFFKLGLIGIFFLAGTSTAQPLVPTDHVLFRMNWPNRFAAQVTDFRTEAATGKIDPESSSVTFEYGVKGVRDSQGYLIRNSAGKVAVSSNLAPSMNRFIRNIVEVSNRNFPVIRVSTAGAISVPNFEKGVSKSIADLRKKNGSQDSDRVVRQLFSAPQMAAAIQDQWGRMVQMWNGVDLKIGSWYQSNGQEYVPQLGQMVPSEFYFRVLSRVPCRAGASDRDCVLIEGKSIPDEKEVGQVLSAGGAGVPSTDARVVTMFTLVTDPSTLLPYLYQESRESLFGTTNTLMVARIRYRYL